MIRSGLALLVVIIPQLLSAQEDSVYMSHDDVRRKLEDKQLFSPYGSSFIESLPSTSVKYLSTQPLPSLVMPISDTSLKEMLRLPYQTNPSLLFKGDFSTGGIMKQFDNGALLGSGRQTSLPGIGRINDASLGYRHALNDRLTLQLGVNAMKMNMMYSTRQAFSTSGSLMYQASDRLAFKVFGSYDIGNSYGMSTNSYGASMSLDMSDSFGMEVGVQRYYDSMRGRWETVPMVIPYFNVNKMKLGLDVGGILYEILRSTVFDKKDWGGGPTIGPPRFSVPIKGR